MSPPRLRRTGPLDLAVPLFGVGLIAYALLRVFYGRVPPFGYFVPVPLGVLAIIEFIVARRVRLAVRHAPRAKPIAAVLVARCVALGKASAVVGAGVAGAAAALLARVIPIAGTVSAAANDTRVGALVFVAAVLLVAAGLVLERAGLDPNDRDSQDKH